VSAKDGVPVTLPHDEIGWDLMRLVMRFHQASAADLRPLGLEARQIEVLRLMVSEGQTMSAGRYRELFAVNRRTAQRNLGEPVAKGQAKRAGQGAAHTSG